MRGLLDLHDQAFRLLLSLIEERTGLYYDPSRRDFVLDRITPLLVERGIRSLVDYYYLLKYDSGAPFEWQRLQTALTVNETYFWREYDQVEMVVRDVVPRLQQVRPDEPVRIWHAGCSSGEEAYTMAISLLRAGRFLHGPIDIVGSDMDQVALERARIGMYPSRSLRQLPQDVQEVYLRPTPDGRFQVTQHVRERVRFEYTNLVDEALVRQRSGLDVIFCRNVFIYFSKPTVEKVVRLLHDILAPEGMLFLGASESLLRLDAPFELRQVGRCFCYVRS